QALIRLRQLGRAIARTYLTATCCEAGAHLRGDGLVLYPGRHFAPYGRDTSDGSVEKAGGGDFTHALGPRASLAVRDVLATLSQEGQPRWQAANPRRQDPDRRLLQRARAEMRRPLRHPMLASPARAGRR